MTPAVRRTGIYDLIEARRVRDDTVQERCGLAPVNDPGMSPMQRVDHLRRLVEQLPDTADPTKILVAVCGQAVAWLEALDAVEECKVHTGEAA